MVGIPERMVTVLDAENRAAAATNSANKLKKKTPAKAKPKQPLAAKQTAASASTTTKVPAVAATRAPLADSTATNATAVNKVQRARGVLYGLSTLQRQGNVRVNVLSDHTTVRSNFRLGPLQLRVEKAFGRGAKRELKSATATTTEMVGRITLRIVNGAATLHSIKVQQPRQVQVVSADNHDRTREFVWRKSAHIADVVSEQLTDAARSMLLPPPEGASGQLVVATESADEPIVSVPEQVTKTTKVVVVGKEELAAELHQERLDEQQQQTDAVRQL